MPVFVAGFEPTLHSFYTNLNSLAPSTGRVAAAALPPPSATSFASACSTAISSSTLPVTQACRKRRTISSESRLDTVKRGRESRSRPRVREDLPRVRLAFAEAPRDLVDVELEFA